MSIGRASITIAVIGLFVAILLFILDKGHPRSRLFWGVLCLLAAVLFGLVGIFSLVPHSVVVVPTSIQPQSVPPLAEPLIYWRGASVPFSQIHDPQACPACGYFLVIGGKVNDYKAADGSNQLQAVIISGGEVKGYTWKG